MNLNYLIGMTEAVALEHLFLSDIRHRVTRRDSIVAMVTSDLDLERVNLEIDNGKVSKAEYG